MSLLNRRHTAYNTIFDHLVKNNIAPLDHPVKSPAEIYFRAAQTKKALRPFLLEVALYLRYFTCACTVSLIVLMVSAIAPMMISTLNAMTSTFVPLTLGSACKTPVSARKPWNSVLRMFG